MIKKNPQVEDGLKFDIISKILNLQNYIRSSSQQLLVFHKHTLQPKEIHFPQHLDFQFKLFNLAKLIQQPKKYYASQNVNYKFLNKVDYSKKAFTPKVSVKKQFERQKPKELVQFQRLQIQEFVKNQRYEFNFNKLSPKNKTIALLDSILHRKTQNLIKNQKYFTESQQAMDTIQQLRKKAEQKYNIAFQFNPYTKLPSQKKRKHVNHRQTTINPIQNKPSRPQPFVPDQMISHLNQTKVHSHSQSRRLKQRSAKYLEYSPSCNKNAKWKFIQKKLELQ